MNEIVKFLELVIFVRMIKLLALFYEIRVTRIIVETIRNLLKPMLNLCGVLFVIFYIFAVFGMFLFGGKITKNNKKIQDNSSIPDNYHLLNFNDFPSAIMTMFPLMVVNNWMVIVDMYVSVYGESSISIRFFFYIFYYLAVIIGINITVAFIIDMYSSVERLDKERTQTL